MARIHLLDRQTAELIAAGEVIERPSSVVKELVENAIDSGATAITVEIQNGGVRFIRVTDNGCGILREDVPTAFLRHATSKVRAQEDLYQIGTLGFRGEALASICAVSRVELLTRTKGEPLGSRYEIAGGVEGRMEDAGCPVGTTILVRDLFYNVPARMKFLKKDSTEGNAIATLLDRLALSHPEIAFKFLREGQRKLQTPGDGSLLSAVHGVYGGDFSGSLIPVEGGSLEGLSVSGFITRPECAKASRGMEHFFINRRYVKSGTMLAALEEAYKNSLMTGKFPGCVLNLEIPFGMVDVNVHPAKLEVKLSDERLVFQGVYQACKGALSALGSATPARDTSRSYQGRITQFELKNRPLAGEQQRMSPEEYRRAAALPPKTPAPAPTKREAARPASPEKKPSSGPVLLREENPGQELYRQSVPQRARLHPAAERRTRVPVVWEVEEEPAPNPPVKPVLEVEREEPCHPSAGPAASSAEPGERQAPPSPAPSAPRPLRLIGEVFCTYILAEGEGELLLIDKHAAHERLLFEKLRAQQAAEGIPRQLLLTSVRVSMPKDRYGALVQGLAAAEQAGFGIEDFGDGSVLVREIPAILELDQLEGAVLELAELLHQNRTRLELDFFDELYHSIACKAAVKGNRFSQREEQQELLDQLAENPQVRNCPHGRPVMIAMSRRELEKMFGRIV